MVHVRTDSHTSPTSISTGVSFLQEKASYIQIQIQLITTLMHYYRWGGETFNWELSVGPTNKHITGHSPTLFDRHCMYYSCR